ncbi:MAG: xanthine dehydrogenase family protein molybdopterin-binding subunit [Proteobacteria bacterium]|nr:xanthine dehydrogenase family protein molybdopterin-binding subunit [Pseudomonadota bacterium]
MNKPQNASEPFRGRVEDDHLLRGQGRFSADLDLPGQAHSAFLRSPHAHAEIVGVAVTAAAAMPGVRLILTGADLGAAGLRGLPCMPGQINADGAPLVVPEWPSLAVGRVRHVGQPVAMVVADTPAAALDAVEAITVEYRELPCVVDAAAKAPAIWPHAPDNVALDPRAGDAAGAAKAFAGAAHVVTTEVVNQRLVVAPMEPRAVVAAYNAADDMYVLHAGSQGVIALRDQVAHVMSLPPDKIRVISRDVGGCFGSKTHVYPEYAPLLVASRRLGRPVKWVATRADTFVSDTQGRDAALRGELALDAAGNFLALRVDGVVNIGAYLSTHGTFIATRVFQSCLASIYRTPAIAARIRCVYSNTVPIAPYRGAGRPEANLLIERLIDVAARQLGRDRVELRRQNVIPPTTFPYATPIGVTYDSGEFAALLDAALARADYAGFAARRDAARSRGKLRGLGIGCYLEVAGGTPTETARLDVAADGRVAIRSALQSNGQGHGTVFPRLVARALGLDPARVTMEEGDSAFIGSGVGSFASRSLMVGGAAMAVVAKNLIDAGRQRAADALEAAPADIEYAGGVFRVAGTDRAVTLAELAARSSLSVTGEGRAPTTFPNGCHITEIEIDPATGAVEIVSHVAIDDVGVCIDRTLVEGQMHGGITQGLGQVFLEAAVYDGGGQLLTGSFMDYALPRADDLPLYDCALREVPCRTNALGVKGAGEAGTTGALCAGYNAVMDALAPLGIAQVDMPATPARLWALIAAATRR